MRPWGWRRTGSSGLVGDGGAELGRGDDVVEVVDLHDGGDGAARLPEEVKHVVPRLLHRRGSRWAA